MSKVLTKLSVAALLAVSMGAYANGLEAEIETDDPTLVIESSSPAESTPTPAVLHTNGQVRFEGQVVNNTCYVSESSRDQLVKLPVVKANDVKNGSGKGTTPFQITLEGCPVAGYHIDSTSGEHKSNVSIYFDNNAPAVTDEGNLKNTIDVANAAKNVAIQVLNKSNSKINLKGDKAAQFALIKEPLKAGEEQVTFNFFAEYVATGNNVEPGFVKSQVPFSIDYQ